MTEGSESFGDTQNHDISPTNADIALPLRLQDTINYLTALQQCHHRNGCVEQGLAERARYMIQEAHPSFRNLEFTAGVSLVSFQTSTLQIRPDFSGKATVRRFLTHPECDFPASPENPGNVSGMTDADLDKWFLKATTDQEDYYFPVASIVDIRR